MIRQSFYLLLSTVLLSLSYSQVTVSPSQLDFGSTSIGETISLELTINNGTSELLQITGVTSTDNQFYAPTPVANIAAFGSDQFTINFVAITNGASSATLTLETNNENFSTIDIPCTGYGASDVSGEASGIWALSNSPFNIVGDITVPNGESLLIEPGVEVIFSDNYDFIVNGALIAQGDEDDHITFKSSNSNVKRGTLLFDYANDVSLINCVFENLKGYESSFVLNDFEDSDNWTTSSGNFYHYQMDNSYSYSGNNSLKLVHSDTYDSGYLHPPSEFSVIAGQDLVVSFWIKPYSISNYCYVKFQYQVNGGDWIQLYSNGSTYDWTYFEYDLSTAASPGDTVEFRFELDPHNNNNWYYIEFYLDDFKVDNYGGGINIHNTDISLRNCVISGVDNCAIYTSSPLDISYSTFLNSTKSAFLSRGNNFYNISNSIIWNNDSENYSQIVIDDGILDINYSNVQGLSSYGILSGDGIVAPGAGNIESNPVFVNSRGMLSDISNSVDAAAPWDQDGAIPPGLGTIRADMGAYGGPLNSAFDGEAIPDGSPLIDSIVDIPQDQGGFIGIQYSASIFDYGHSAHDITHYSFWRELDVEGEQHAGTNPNYTDILTLNREDYWEHVGDMDAQGFEDYGYVAPTLADSNADGEFISTFMVIAHTADNDIYFSSDAASGQSIDNLAPETPMMLSGEFDSGEISLVWSNFVDEDFSYFNLYRNEELYSSVLDSQYVDLEVPNIPELFYSISAVDHNGNESDLSQEIMVQAHLMGDLNDDFQLNILDVVGLMEYILGLYEIEDLTYADLNEDDNVDILDVITLVTIILNENGM